MSGSANRNRCAGESARLRSCEAYIERSPTTSVAMPIASIAGPSIARLSVISATMSITASGAWATLPKSAIIATITNGEGSTGTPGAIGSRSRQIPAPSSPPMTMPGPKTPPEPPEPIDSEVARIFANGSAQDDPQRQAEQRRPVEARLDPAVAGAEDAREDERERTDRRGRRSPGGGPAGSTSPGTTG